MENCKFGNELIRANCQDVAVGGNTGRVWVIDQDWWLAAVGGGGVTVGTDGEITAIALTAAGSGARAWRIETALSSVITGNAFTKNNPGQSGYTHLVSLNISDLSMKMKNAVDATTNFARVVVIVETNAPKGGVTDSKSPPYILFGDKQGLELSAADTNLNDQAIGNAQNITWSTPTAGAQLETSQPVNVPMTTEAIILLETPVP